MRRLLLVAAGKVYGRDVLVRRQLTCDFFSYACARSGNQDALDIVAGDSNFSVRLLEVL